MNFCRFLRLISVIVTLALKRQFFFTLIHVSAVTVVNPTLMSTRIDSSALSTTTVYMNEI